MRDFNIKHFVAVLLDRNGLVILLLKVIIRLTNLPEIFAFQFNTTRLKFVANFAASSCFDNQSKAAFKINPM